MYVCMYVCMIDVIVCSKDAIPGTPWDNNFWLDLDFLDVARAAQRCSAYFTSLLYIEIWCGAKEGHTPNGGHGADSSQDDEVLGEGGKETGLGLGRIK